MKTPKEVEVSPLFDEILNQIPDSDKLKVSRLIGEASSKLVSELEAELKSYKDTSPIINKRYYEQRIKDLEDKLSEPLVYEQESQYDLLNEVLTMHHDSQNNRGIFHNILNTFTIKRK